MASSSINSTESDQRWVEQISETFKPQFSIAIDDAPSIFRVPKSLKDTKPQSYTPHELYLGPYHHLSPKFYTPLQRKRLSAIPGYFEEERFQWPPVVIIKRLVELEPVIRACYDDHLDINAHTLASILSIDGSYLLRLLTSYTHVNISEAAIVTRFSKDLMMLENQIPAVVLKEIRLVLRHSTGEEDHGLFAISRYFCESHSPLKLTEESKFVYDTKSPHYLGYMYFLIVNNRGIDAMIPVTFRRNEFVKTLSSIGKNDGKNHMVEEIGIPCVTQLIEIAKVEFKVSPGGIRDVKFDNEERAFYLPVIILRDDSEVILRNLVAYEAAIAKPDSDLELKVYVDIMCGFIDTPKDVEILREKGIIRGDLRDDEIVGLFNGISKSSWTKKGISELGEVIDKVNQEYANTFLFKVGRFIKVSWKYFASLLVGMLLLLFVWKGFSQIYGLRSSSLALNNGKSDV